MEAGYSSDAEGDGWECRGGSLDDRLVDNEERETPPAEQGEEGREEPSSTRLEALRTC